MKKSSLGTPNILFLVLFVSASSASGAPVNINEIFSNIFSSIIVIEQHEADFRKSASTSSEALNNARYFSFDSNESVIERYFPMHNGDTKSYSWSSYDGTYTYSQVNYNGRSCYLEIDSMDNSKAYYGYSGDELLMYGCEANGLDIRFTSPLSCINNSVLNNGGTFRSSATCSVEGYTIYIDYEITVTKPGNVTVSVGTFNDCRFLSMKFTYRAEGESGSFCLEDTWVLAPKVGKIKIAAMDEFFNVAGWFELVSGTVGGVDVCDLAETVEANFEASPASGVTPLSVNFTDQSTEDANSWFWDFGDGTTSTAQNPSHTYIYPGTYTVCLTVTAAGGSDTLTKTDYIKVACAGADVNKDGNVDLEDAILALQVLSNIQPSALDYQESDVNGDSKVGLEEVIYVLQWLAEKR